MRNPKVWPAVVIVALAFALGGYAYANEEEAKAPLLNAPEGSQLNCRAIGLRAGDVPGNSATYNCGLLGTAAEARHLKLAELVGSGWSVDSSPETGTVRLKKGPDVGVAQQRVSEAGKG